jgi:hypothetical protein
LRHVAFVDLPVSDSVDLLGQVVVYMVRGRYPMGQSGAGVDDLCRRPVQLLASRR